MSEVQQEPKIASRSVVFSEERELRIPAANDGATNARLVRQLLFMARLSHPEKTADDVYQIDRQGKRYHAISVGSSNTSMDYNPEVYGPIRYVEDLVD